MAESGAGTTVVDSSAVRLLESKVNDLERDNKKYRDKLRDKTTELDELKKKVPAEGSVVLNAEDAKAWKGYQELGKLEDLKKTVTERDELKEKVAQQEHQTAAAEAATAAGYNVKALLKLPGTDKLKFEVKKEKVDNQDVDIAYVTDTAKQGATPQKLSDWIDANHAEMKPALAADAAEGERRSGDRRYVAQRSTGDAAKPDNTEKIEQRQRAEIGTF